REGFETVLFYQALLGSAPAGDVMVPAGFAAGTAALAVVYLVLSRFGVHIPIRPFFLAPGSLPTLMALSFAGHGLHQLPGAATDRFSASSRRSRPSPRRGCWWRPSPSAQSSRSGAARDARPRRGPRCTRSTSAAPGSARESARRRPPRRPAAHRRGARPGG